MLKVIVPVALMIIIVLVKQIPKIGGSIQAALIAAGIAALIMGGIYNPVAWLQSWISGVDRIAWVMGLSIFGSIYAEAQSEIGALDTMVRVLRAAFAKSPKGLVVTVIIALWITGALLGDGVAAATVVGILTIGAMADIGLSPEKIVAIIVIGSQMGSIMPPVTQSITLAASLVGVNADEVMAPAYITVGLGIAVFVCHMFYDLILLPPQKGSSIF